MKKVTVIEWIIDIWNEGVWYKQFYLLSAGGFILFAILTAVFLIPYLKVAEEVYKEYEASCSKHFFIRFRSNKQIELFQAAELKVENSNPQFPLYLWKKVFSRLAYISFGLTFWLVIGSFVYEFFSNLPESDSTYIVDDYYDDGGYSDDFENGIHHVEPHWVDGYQRSDGTEVKGYWRGGDSGYDRSNPDGNPFNNLKR